MSRWALLLITYLCVALPTRVSAASLEKLMVGSSCTDACDAASPPGSPGDYRFICGTDGRTYNTTIATFKANDCYSYCGVAARYVGLCGCPNHCGEHIGHGQCITVNATNDLRCQCAPGFGGADCMMVDCASGNTPCSDHGTCVTHSAFGDYCACDESHTGAYCAESVFEYPLYDTIVPDVPPLLLPGNEFVTPLLNLSVIGDLRIAIDQSDFDYLVDPFTVYNSSRESKPITLFYTNGNHLVQNVSASMQVKGATSRLDLKKGWTTSLG
jgi:hypothetical protein